MQIIPDPLVVALQLIPFLLTLAALHFIIFKPMLEYLDDRDKARVGGREEADALQERIAEKVSKYDARMEDARAQVVDHCTDCRHDAQATAAERMAAARADADALVKAAVADIDAERRAASESVEQTARELSEEIAGRVLGRDLLVG
ncbi:MAG: ATP synthase F0 subunit B [Oligoflexia bacterium]|nr:ATP synthase F0 subunit B [Oligoflexia bacterium]